MNGITSRRAVLYKSFRRPTLTRSPSNVLLCCDETRMVPRPQKSSAVSMTETFDLGSSASNHEQIVRSSFCCEDRLVRHQGDQGLDRDLASSRGKSSVFHFIGREVVPFLRRPNGDYGHFRP